MTMNIDVSVVTATFRREHLLPQAITSALSQKGVTLEVIVVDDSGEASAREAVAKLNDPRIRYVARTKPSGGPAIPRNDGAALAKGRYIHFLDDDDLLVDGALAALVGALDKKPSASMGFGIVTPFGDNTEDLRGHSHHHAMAARIARNLRSTRELVANLLFHPAILVNSTCMVRREAFAATGGFDAAIHIGEDLDLWGRVARLSGGHIFVDRPILRYRTGAPSITNGSDVAGKMRASYQRMHAKYRETHGAVEFFAMKLWARTLLRRSSAA